MVGINSARPISICISLWGAAIITGLLWKRRYQRRFDCYHSYLTNALHLVKEDETFQSIMGENPKLLKYRSGSINSFGSKGRAILKMEGNNHKATIIFGGVFIEDGIRKIVLDKEYEDLNMYYKTGGADTLIIKPYLIKLMIKKKISDFFNGFIYSRRLKPKFAGDTSHWEVENISIVYEPKLPLHQRLWLFLRGTMNKESIEKEQRAQYTITSIRGFPSTNPNMEHYLNPLTLKAQPTTKRRLRLALLAAIIAVLLSIRRRHRIGIQLKTEQEFFILNTLRSLPSVIKKFGTDVRIVRMSGETSIQFIDSRVKFTGSAEENKKQQMYGIMRLIAGRSDAKQPYHIYTCEIDQIP